MPWHGRETMVPQPRFPLWAYIGYQHTFFWAALVLGKVRNCYLSCDGVVPAKNTPLPLPLLEASVLCRRQTLSVVTSGWNGCAVPLVTCLLEYADLLTCFILALHYKEVTHKKSCSFSKAWQTLQINCREENEPLWHHKVSEVRALLNQGCSKF